MLQRNKTINKKIEKLIKNPICLQGGYLGQRPRPPPFCVKSVGAPEGGGVEACNTGLQPRSA